MENTPHFELVDGERQLVVEGRPLTLLAGEVHNSTGSSAAWLERAWNKAEELGLSALLVAVTWELLEPEEGVFDYSGVDALIEQARKYGALLRWQARRLLPIWRGALFLERGDSTIY